MMSEAHRIKGIGCEFIFNQLQMEMKGNYVKISVRK